VLATVFVVALILGQVVLAFDLLPALTFPPFYVLGAVLPPLFFLAFVGRSLAEGDIRWREVILQLSSGAFLATLGAFGSEAVLGLLSMVIVFTLAALTQGSAAWFQELSAHLQNPRWFQNPENTYSLLLSPPVLIALGLTVLVIAPMAEEMFKSLGVVIMSYRRPSKARAFLWGLAGGAGFALAEGLFSGAISLESWGQVALLRVGAAAMHCLGGGMMGLGWHYLFVTRRPWRLLGAYAASVGLHSLWNLAAFGIHKPHVSKRAWITILLGRHLHRVHVVPARLQHLQRLLKSLGIEEIRNDHCQTSATAAPSEVLERLRHVGCAADLKLFEHFEHTEDASLALSGRPFLAHRRVKRHDRHAIKMRQPDVAQRGRETQRLFELLRPLPRRCHGVAGVDEQVDRQVLFFVKQAQQQAAKPAVRLPVDMPEVVASRVLPIVGKLQPTPTFWREPFRTSLPCKRLLGDDVQVLELLEEVAVEPYGHGEKPSYASGETPATSSFTITSASICSASPSKFSSTRCRRAGNATARMLSGDTNACPCVSA